VIVDTNALSAWLGEDKNLAIVLAEAPQLILSSIVLGEYRFGVKTSKYAKLFNAQLDALEEDFDVAKIDGRTAGHYADIRFELKRAGTPIPWHDIWIAAQARQLGLPVLSNDRHFDCVAGLKRIGW